MKPRAWFFAAALVLGAVELVAACSQQVPLQTAGGKCEYDEQCSEALVCKCVKRRNPDDEGPDEIVAPGTCQEQAYKCTNTDAGASTDTGTTDSGTTDSGTTDSGTTDSGTTDSGPLEGGTDAADAG